MQPFAPHHEVSCFTLPGTSYHKGLKCLKPRAEVNPSCLKLFSSDVCHGAVKLSRGAVQSGIALSL